MLTSWWIWTAGGVLLLVLEAFTTGAIFLGFGIGAIVVGLLLLLGGPVGALLAGSVPLLLLIFAVISLVSWLILRRVLGVRRGQVKVWDRDINEN